MKFIDKYRRAKWLPSLVFGTVVGIIITVVILALAGPGNVWSNFQSLNYVPFSIYIVLLVSTNLLRSWRFRLLVGKGTLAQLYGIVSVHTLMINLLPFGSGEISYPLLLKRYGVSAGFKQGIPSLMIARLNDVLVNLALAFIALVWLGGLGLVMDQARGGLVTLGMLILLVAGGAGLVVYGRRSFKSPVSRRVTGLLVRALSPFRKVPLSVWGGAFFLTIGIRIVSLISVFYLLQTIGLDLPVPFVFLYTALYVFLALLPINSVAGLGITEAYSTVLFVVSGIGPGAAAAASIQLHALQLLMAVVVGVVGFLLLQYLKSRGPRQALEPAQPLA